MKKRGFWLSSEDELAIAMIVDRYACVTDVQAVRLALKLVSESPTLPVQLPAPPKHSRRSPKLQKSAAESRDLDSSSQELPLGKG